MNEVKKYRNIDALRTFGCLAIIAWHVKANMNFNGGVLQKIIPSFDYLVYLFMIISGFGMCNGYYHKLKSGMYDLNTFYANRYKRTVPFFATLIFLDCVIEFSPETLYEGLMEVTMLFGFLPNNSLNVIGVAWTLGAIFAFYILFPFTVFLLYSRRRAIMSFAVSILITFMCQNYFMTKKFVTDSFVMRHSFLYCLPFFLMGGLIFLYKNEISSVVNKFKWICLFVLLALTLGYYVTPNIWVSVDIIVIKTLMLYAGWLCIALGDENILLSNRVTKQISNISMEMYLSHMVVFRFIEKTGIADEITNSFLRYLIVYIALVILLVTVLTLYKKITSGLFKLR